MTLKRGPSLIQAYVSSMLIFALLRGAFYLYHAESFADDAGGLIAYRFLIGAMVDSCVAATTLCVVQLLGLGLGRLSVIVSRRVSTGLILAAFGLYFLIGLVDIWYFEMFDSRMNVLVFFNLEQPGPIMSTIVADYPLWQVLLIWSVTVFAFWLSLRRPYWQTLERVQIRYPKASKVATVMLFFFLSFLWTAEPFWRTAAFTDMNPAGSQLSLNGVYTLYKGYYQWRLPRTDFGIRGPGAQSPEEALETIQRALISDEYTQVSDLYHFARQITAPVDRPGKAPNIVIVILESFWAAHVGCLNPDGKGLTPNLDSLARKGILFTRFYAHETRTQHALTSVVGSFPSILGNHIARHSGTDPFHTLGTLLRDKGYQTSFIYGYDSRFDHMSVFMKRSGFDRIYDQDDFPPDLTRYTWGVSDGALFEKANEILSTQDPGKPFLSVIMTSTSHPPYDVPESYFEEFPSARSLEGLAAFSYTDWAVGQFIEQAAEQPYFENTIFVFVADHGQKSRSSDEQGKRFHIPLILYSPNLIDSPRRVNTIGGQVDIATTLLHLIGYRDAFHFLGRDLLTLPESDGWVLMRSNDILYFRFDGYVIAGDVRDTVVTLYAVDSTERIRVEAIAERDSLSRRMESLARAYYQTVGNVFKAGLHRVP